MTGWLEQEAWLRFIPFVGIFALMTVWEVLSPRRTLTVTKSYRWLNNLGIVVLNSLLLRLVFPSAAVGVALFVEARGWGLFHLAPVSEWALWLTLVICVLLLDFAVWVQHVLFHAVPVLWRLHRMHHADQDFDVTTGLRFHPLEILLSMVIKAGVILMLGIPAAAVLFFEILLNATSMFNHGNVRIPLRLDRLLRWVIVTPDMHRVHHSWYPDETNSNFGFNFPWWDRLLGTYRSQPRDGHLKMTIGINQFRQRGDLRLDRLLNQPFIAPVRSELLPARSEDDDHDK